MSAWPERVGDELRQPPRATRSISSRTSRSTSSGRLLSSQSCSIGRSISSAMSSKRLLAARRKGLGQFAEGGRDLRSACSDRIAGAAATCSPSAACDDRRNATRACRANGSSHRRVVARCSSFGDVGERPRAIETVSASSLALQFGGSLRAVVDRPSDPASAARRRTRRSIGSGRGDVAIGCLGRVAGASIWSAATCACTSASDRRLRVRPDGFCSGWASRSSARKASTSMTSATRRRRRGIVAPASPARLSRHGLRAPGMSLSSMIRRIDARISSIEGSR